MQFGTAVDFTVSSISGDGVLDFGDNSLVYYCDNSSSDAYFTHNYTSLGAYLPFVEPSNVSTVSN